MAATADPDGPTVTPTPSLSQQARDAAAYEHHAAEAAAAARHPALQLAVSVREHAQHQGDGAAAPALVARSARQVAPDLAHGDSIEVTRRISTMCVYAYAGAAHQQIVDLSYRTDLDAAATRAELASRHGTVRRRCRGFNERDWPGPLPSDPDGRVAAFAPTLDDDIALLHGDVAACNQLLGAFRPVLRDRLYAHVYGVDTDELGPTRVVLLTAGYPTKMLPCFEVASVGGLVVTAVPERLLEHVGAHQVLDDLPDGLSDTEFIGLVRTLGGDYFTRTGHEPADLVAAAAALLA